MNPVEAIRRGPFWNQWPSTFDRNLAHGMITRGEKGVSKVINNIAKMQKAVEAARKVQMRVVTKMGDPTWAKGLQF